MRLYLPATASELLADTPPARLALTFTPPPDVHGEALEALAEEVLYEAAFASLELVYETEAAPCRIVLVAEINLGAQTASAAGGTAGSAKNRGAEHGVAPAAGGSAGTAGITGSAGTAGDKNTEHEAARCEAWEQVQAIHVDGQVGQEIIASLQQAETQEQADELVEKLDEEPLEWFSPLERLDLAASLAAAFTDGHNS